MVRSSLYFLSGGTTVQAPNISQDSRLPLQTAAADTPRSEYAQRLQACKQTAEEYARTEHALSNARLVLFALALVMAWLAWHDGLFSGWLLVLPLAAFLGLASRHDRAIGQRRQALRGAAFYETGLLRLNDKWQGMGQSGARFLQAEHPYAVDLDIFGRASLFELLCTARTQGGEQHLADWLRAASDAPTVRARQDAVAELRPRLELREDLAILGEQTRGTIHPESLAAWGRQPATIFTSVERGTVGVLTAATLAAAWYWNARHNIVPFLLAFGVQQLFARTLLSRIRQVAGTVEKPARDLAVFALLLARIEREPAQAKRLLALRALLDVQDTVPPSATAGGDNPASAYHSPQTAQRSSPFQPDTVNGQMANDPTDHNSGTPLRVPPSARIARLERLAELLEIPHNPFMKLLDAVLQFSPFCVFAIEDWRQRNGAHIGDWIQAVGEYEALSALAGYAYEHPNDPFPVILEPDTAETYTTERGASRPAADDNANTAPPHTPLTISATISPAILPNIVLEARGLSHPLLPAASAVRNDLTLSSEQRLYIVSGSNMSGKSTLMRALGTNVVLALAGGPVRAHSLRLIPLAIGASIRTQDSLEAGISRFYAEILRLRQIVDMANQAPPLLFLLDEILHGTNSHDRLTGAEAVLRTLIARNAIGLVSTHDLALARIADDPTARALNVHLQDQLKDGKMAFDYYLRAGVVAKSNAIELMRAVGLEV